MRVGLVTGEYPPMEGGVGAYTQMLARHLADQNHDVFVLSSTYTREIDERIHLSPWMERWHLGSPTTVRRWATENRVDVVNLQYQTAAYAMSPWIHFIPDRLPQLPVVTTFHDLRLPYLFPKAGRLRDWIVLRLASSSDGVIATNHEDMARLHHLPCATLIPIGSNILQPLPRDFDPAAWRQRAGANEDDLLLSFFGLINRSKGLDVLLDTVAALRSQDIPARLLIIGGSAGSSDPTNKPYLDEIQAKIERLALAPYIHWTGFVDEESVAQFLASADMVLFPFRDGASYRRGSLMAAIHYGCVIVTTQPVISIPTFLDGENMILVGRESSDAIVSAVVQLYRQPELRAKLKHGAMQLSRQFEWSQIARDTAAFYERVIGAQA